MPLQNTTIEGTLTIDGVPMNPANGAWATLGDERGEGGLLQLWAMFAVRGQDRVLPGAPGVIAYPRRITQTRIDLRFLMVGDVIGETGVPAANSIEGLAQNTEYIRANVLAPVVSTDGTRPATLTIPGLASRTADVHVLGIVLQSYMLGECGSIAVNTLQLSIPDGRFS